MLTNGITQSCGCIVGHTGSCHIHGYANVVSGRTEGGESNRHSGFNELSAIDSSSSWFKSLKLKTLVFTWGDESHCHWLSIHYHCHWLSIQYNIK